MDCESVVPRLRVQHRVPVRAVSSATRRPRKTRAGGPRAQKVAAGLTRRLMLNATNCLLTALAVTDLLTMTAYVGYCYRFPAGSGYVRDHIECRISKLMRLILFGVLAVVLSLCHLNHIRLLTN